MPQAEYSLCEYRTTRFETAAASVCVPPDYPMFPLIHCADLTRQTRGALSAERILRLGRIEPVMCKVFGEELVYTYIGRPAYREFLRPVCFILKPLPGLLQNLFVFDTGAYSESRYRRLVDSFQDIHLFRIPADMDSVRKFILKYFGSNENYFFSRASGHPLSDPMDSLEEFSYEAFRVLDSFRVLGFDDRCRTLENIIRGPVVLAHALQGVILPESGRRPDDYPGWDGSVPPGVDLMTYDDRNGLASPGECHESLNRVLYGYYREKGVFKSDEPGKGPEDASEPVS